MIGVREELYQLRTQNLSLKGQVADLQQNITILHVNAVNRESNGIVDDTRMIELQQTNAKLKDSLRTNKSKNIALKNNLKAVIGTLKLAAKKAANEKSELTMRHEKAMADLNEEIDCLKIMQDTEMFRVKQRYAQKERELKDKFEKLAKSKEENESQYEESLRSMIVMVDNDECSHPKSNKIENDSEMEELRAEVKMMKIDHAYRLSQTENEFEEWRKNYSCPACTQKKKKKFFGLF